MLLRYAFVLLGLALTAETAAAQVLAPVEQARLDPRFQAILAEALPSTGLTRTSFPLPAHMAERSTAAKRGETVWYGAIVQTDDVTALRAAGIAVNSELPGYATVRVTAEELVTLARLESVRYIDAGATFYPTNDLARAATGVDELQAGVLNNTAYKGDNVIVCVIDSGIDWDHLDFRDPADNTKSRILSIWDVTQTAAGAEQTPEDRKGIDFACCDYGVEFVKTEIEDELDGSPAGFVDQVDTEGHGTHVTGTAAGNGAAYADRSHAGMAPNADIVTVKAGDAGFSNFDLINALSYCREVANDEGKPVVVNMSLGGHTGPHDGTGSTEAAVDAFVNDGTQAGRAVVIAAGNEGTDNMHIGGTVPANGGTATVTLDVSNAYTPFPGIENDGFVIELWLDTNGAADIDVTVTSPDGHTVTQNTTGSSTAAAQGGADIDGTVFVVNDQSTANNDWLAGVVIFDGAEGEEPQSGNWTITLTNNDGSAYAFDGWLQDMFIGLNGTVDLVGGDANKTVGTPGVATHAITVGSFITRALYSDISGFPIVGAALSTSDDLSDFSSRGPRRDGVTKPEITAPGQGVISSMSSDASISTDSRVVGGQHYLTQGTSMATPGVAGAIALLFQQNSTLTSSQVKTLLTDAADCDAFVSGSCGGFTSDNEWGHGKLDAFEAMVKAINAGGSTTREVIAFDTWTGDTGAAINAGEKAAVRFSPAQSGRVTGAFFHPSTTNTRTADIAFEIWSDNAGLPSAKLAGTNTVTFDEDALMNFSWNYVDMTGAAADLTAGTDYHLVFDVTTGGGNLSLRGDNGSPDGRSSLEFGGSFVTNAAAYINGDFDWRLRPVVNSVTGVENALPVELIAFGGVATEEGTLLTWKTASETNNAGFAIEQRYFDGAFAEVDFIAGQGTTLEAQTYTHQLTGLAPGTYQFRLKQVDFDGTFEYSPEVEVTVEMPEAYVLSDVYPNPFNPTAQFSLLLRQQEEVSIGVYDVTGRRVAVLHQGRLDPSRLHMFTLDASTLASGLYLVRTAGETFSDTRRALLVK
ncbi:MAG: S8 family serine peptidase [Bacteroidota bacterium]